MSIKVELYPPFNRLIGQKVIEVSDPIGTLDELLDYISEHYNKMFKKEVMEGLQDYSYFVMLNGRPMWDMATLISSADVVAISAHFAGE